MKSYHDQLSFKTKILNRFRKMFTTQKAEQFLINKIKGGNNFYLKLIPPEYLYKAPSWRMYHDGVRLKLDISNVVDHEKYFHVPDIGLSWLLQSLSSADTVVDIGANIGVTAVEFASRAGKVICFEPSPSNFSRLVENVSLNKFPNIILKNTGIGKQKQTLKLYNLIADNPGMKRILSKDSGDEYEQVEIDTLEHQLNELNINQVTAIKIDVEGFELEVLKGGEQILKRDHPLLFIELDDNNLREHGDSAGQLVEFLQDFNYSCFRASTRKPISMNDLEGCHFDIYCK